MLAGAPAQPSVQIERLSYKSPRFDGFRAAFALRQNKGPRCGGPPASSIVHQGTVTTVDNFADLSALNDLRNHTGSPSRRAFDGKWIALFCDGDQIFAIDDVCLRCRASLTKGALAGTVVTCSCGWRYDVEYGQVLGFPRLRIHTYPVKLIAGRVLVGSHGRSG